MSDLGTLSIEVRGDLSGLDRDFDKARGDADGWGKKISGSFGSAFKIGMLAAGAGVAVGLGKFLGGAVSEMQDAVKTGKQTAAVIQSTGGAANVSAKHVDSLSTSLSNMSGIDDEAIAAGENMLLTFTNVQNRVGKGNDIFDQATGSILDMSVAMGQDMKQTAIQVGKALNDPIKGITALSRVGVTFTQQQKDQIKAMVEVGNVTGAQKVILAELNKEFGGSAKAQATSADKMKVAWANLQESAGMALAPLLAGAADLGVKLLPKVASGIEQIATKAGPIVKLVGVGFAAMKAAFSGEGVTSVGFVGVMERIGVAARAVVDWVVANWPKISAVIGQVLTTVGQVVAGAVDVVMTIWHNFGSQITAVAKAAWDFILRTVDAALQTVQGIIKIVTGLIHGDWSRVWEGIKQVFGAVWDSIVARVDFAMALIPQLISAGWEIVKAIFGGVVDWIGGRVEDLVGFFTSLPGRIADAAVGMWDGISDAFRSALNWIISKWNNLEFKLPSFGGFHIGGQTIVPGWEGPTLGTPDIPLLDKGGIVTGPTLAQLAMNRKPEAIIPLDRLGAMGGGGNVYITVKGSVISERQLLGVARDGLSRVGRHNVDSGVKTRSGR